MKFEYPITADYIRDWKPLDALREFGANALDAELTHGAKASITYDAKKKTVLFKNDGVTLSREALLLGGTGKADRDDTVGTYGEGMKMGFLVCSREGLIVNVRNGRTERWVPRMEYSERWESKILVLDVTTAKRQVETFEVEVIGVEMELWEALQDLFLKLRPAATEIRTNHGALLVDPEKTGRIYAKGVFVQWEENYASGYDLLRLGLNRDRKFTAETGPHIASVWREIVSEQPEQLARAYDLLAEGSPEGEAMKYYASGRLAEGLLAEFRSRHGDDAYIARNAEESRAFEHYGVRAVVPGSTLFYVLANLGVGTLQTYRATHKYDIRAELAYGDLTDDERRVFDAAHAALREVGLIVDGEERISVVEFVDPKIKGLHRGPEVKLARSVLASFGRTVTYLAHEFAHDKGRDGEKDHVDALQDALARVLDLLAARG